MAALNRPTTANYEVHENVKVDTQDNEDHTFCGILFPIRIKQDLPVSKLVLRSVAVRGRLGHMTVWVSNENAPTGPPPQHRHNNNNNNNNNDAGGMHHFRLQQRHWTKVYEQYHSASVREYQTFDFSNNPVILQPGTVRAIYIHSTLAGDEAIVYDNTRHPNAYAGGGHWGIRRPPARNAPTTPRYEDDFLCISTGKAHLSNEPFGQTNIWGWDNAWRDYREFVGQVNYGTVFQLWQPSLHSRLFGSQFDECTRTLFALQRRYDSPVSMLPDECIFYILNMCRWDWFQDTSADMKAKRRERKSAALQQQREEEDHQQQRSRMVLEDSKQSAAAVPPVGILLAPDSVETSGSTACSASGCQRRDASFSSAAQPDEDTEFFDAQQDMSTNDDDEGEEAEGGGNADTEMSERAVGGGGSVNGSDGDDEEGFSEDDPDYANEEDDGDDNEDDDDGEDWDRANGYRANPSFLTYRYVSSDDEEDNDDDDEDNDVEAEDQRAWFRRHFARIHILRALAQVEDVHEDGDRVVLMRLD